MDAKESDYLYILIAIAISVVGVVAIRMPKTPVGMCALIGLLGIAVVMTIFAVSEQRGAR